MPNLYILQLAFSMLLSIWLGFTLFCSTTLETHFLISMSQENPLLGDCYKEISSDTNDHKAHINKKTHSQKTDVYYQISSRSRCTQLCIFLILEPTQEHIIGLSSAIKVVPNNDKIADMIKSIILFKWQTTESHYRALASAITQNTKLASQQ
jgi:hypothetical protein